MTLASRLRRRTRAWARKRHGLDSEPHVIPKRRIYILPTRLGLFFGGLLFLMFLGAMNYANNLALGLTFLLAALGIVTMHHCQRNLAGIEVSRATTDAVFAGQSARFTVALENTGRKPRHEIRVQAADGEEPEFVFVAATGRALAHVSVPTHRRGRLRLEHVQISTDYPFGLFRAWTHVHLPLECVVYPKPAPRGLAPEFAHTDTGGAQDSRRGDEDFAGLRTFQGGDSPGRVAWKVYARGLGLQVKLYAGTAVTAHVIDWEALRGMETEARLAQLCRWVEDAHSAGNAFSLRLPGDEITENVGHAHRQRCLTALAMFGGSDRNDVFAAA